jgi:hypothetical protein
LPRFNPVIFPAITPEQLYDQDKRRREWDEQERRMSIELAKLRERERLGLVPESGLRRMMREFNNN